MRTHRLGGILLAGALFAAGCSTARRADLPASFFEARNVPADATRRPLVLSRQIEDKILALDPEHVTGADISGVLSNVPAPRIIKLRGGRWPTYKYMVSFSKFLVGMGYPEAMVAGPGAEYSFSSYVHSSKITGAVAWYYERDAGLRPMIIGHSLGGMQAVRVLYQLDGRLAASIPVWNPESRKPEPRTEIVDPLTGRKRSVVGLEVSYASAVGSGGFTRFLPNQWTMCGRLRKIPDSTRAFTGYHMGFDLLGGDFAGFGSANDSRALGQAQVRNVTLPSFYPHGTVPASEHLLEHREVVDWINAYQPETKPRLTVKLPGDTAHILWAADVWHDIKKHWVLELQRVIRVQRAATNDS